MKEYSVVYLAEAEQELISIWEHAADRSRIAEAANSADKALATVPRDRSVCLGEGLRRLEIAPLRFYFAIREDDWIVEVSNVILNSDTAPK
jgi:hypothetical protein